jgi:glycosyltransferase involved in cell wall biosynthesis
MTRKKISVCIPVFNEAESLPTAITEVEALFAGELSEYELELVVTDNASVDQTWAVAVECAASRPHLRAYRF